MNVLEIWIFLDEFFPKIDIVFVLFLLDLNITKKLLETQAEMDGLLNLNKLLNKEGESSDDDEPNKTLGAQLGPGSIGTSSKKSTVKANDVYGIWNIFL